MKTTNQTQGLKQKQNQKAKQNAVEGAGAGAGAMKAILYARVSTEKQSVEPQMIELRAWCGARGWEVVGVETDVMSGGRVAGREGLGRVMEAVRVGGCGAVVVVKIDRLARSLREFAGLVGEMDRCGVALVATSQGIDTSRDNPAGRLQMHVLGAVAEFERSLIRERVVAGMAAARARGVVLGKPSAKLVGVDVGGVVAKWREEGEGWNVRKLAGMLGGVSVSTAWRLAKQHDGVGV